MIFPCSLDNPFDDCDDEPMTTSPAFPAITPDSIAAALITDMTADAFRDAPSFLAMIADFDRDFARIADIIIDDARDSDTFHIFLADDADDDAALDAYLTALHDDRTHAMLMTALDRLFDFHYCAA